MPDLVFGSSGVRMIWRGLAIGPIVLRDVVAKLGDERRLVGVAQLGGLLERHERHDRLAGRLVGRADDRGLCDGRVADERVLHLGGREPVARDVHDVVDPAEEPQVAVVVALGAVAREIACPGTSSSRCP